MGRKSGLLPVNVSARTTLGAAADAGVADR